MSSLRQGIIVKVYGGFYHVSDGNSVVQCTVRGLFRHRKIDVRVGDRVAFSVKGTSDGLVEEVYPRRNNLVRPPVANVDRSVIVFAARDPDPSLMLLDRFLIQSEHEDVQPVICINKIDLLQEKNTGFWEAYTAAGYTVLLASTRDGTGIAELRKTIAQGITIFAGPSGVGKSSLLNAVQPGLSLKTGEIGHKLKRGRHTTRHVELLTLGEGGLVADSPGFSTLFLPELVREELCFYFPEMEKYIPHCKYKRCLHRAEPHCAVKEAVGKGIDGGRYQRYLEILGEVIDRERSY